MESDRAVFLKAPNKKFVVTDRVAKVVSAALFLSGLTSITYEVVWQRLLVRTTGATLPAVSTIFCIFIAGLWLGSLISIPLVRRTQYPLRLYAFIEMLIASFGIGVPVLFSDSCSQSILATVSNILAAFSSTGELLMWQAALLQNLLYFAALLVPAVLIGLTFNCVAKFAENSYSDNFSSSSALSRFYAINIIGGAVGCLLSSFVLVPNVGLTITSMIMALVNLVAFFLLLGSSIMTQPSDDPIAQLLALLTPPPAPAPQSTGAGAPAQALAEAMPGVARTASFSHKQILCLATACSVLIMILEVSWTRLMMLLLGSSTYSLSGVLSMVFIAFAFSANLAAKPRDPSSLMRFVPQAFLIGGASVAVSSWLIPFIPLFLLSFQQMVFSICADQFCAFLIPRLTICGALILPAITALGLIFPILLRMGTVINPLATDAQASATVSLEHRAEQRADHTIFIGHIFAASSLGSIFGSLLAAYVLIPHPLKELVSIGSRSGIESTLTFSSLALLALGVAALLMLRSHSLSRAFLRIFWSSCAIVLLAVCLRPLWNLQLLTLGTGFFQLSDPIHLTQERLLASISATTGANGLLFYKEGLNQTVSVEESGAGNVRFLKNDGKTEAALPIVWSKPSPTTDAATHLLLACLPFHFCEKKQDVSTLVIGFGSGITSGALACRPECRKVEVAELEPAVYQSSKLFEPSNLLPIERVVARVVDGRNFLRTHDASYDLIISQPSEPWISGASDLFTREFWHLARRKLNKNGVFCQWVQLYWIDRATLKSIIATFNESFPECYLLHSPGAGEVLLIGKCDGGGGVYKIGAINAYLETSLNSVRDRIDQLNGSEGLTDGLRDGLTLNAGDRKTINLPHLSCDLLLGPGQLGSFAQGAPLNTDDRLITEYALASQMIGRGDNVTSNLQWLSSK